MLVFWVKVIFSYLGRFFANFIIATDGFLGGTFPKTKNLGSSSIFFLQALWNQELVLETMSN
jgi:hypothetical protein